MTFLTRVDRQFMLRNWISRNLKPIKRFNMYYGDSRILLRLAKENDERLADIDHEEFKQAMARCGFYADTSYTDEHCTSDIAAEYAYKALVSVAEMSKQYNTIIELLNNIAISEHGNTHEQTE